jgi:hypothetical protein
MSTTLVLYICMIIVLGLMPFFYLSICKATPGFFALKVMQLLNCFD